MRGSSAEMHNFQNTLSQLHSSYAGLIRSDFILDNQSIFPGPPGASRSCWGQPGQYGCKSDRIEVAELAVIHASAATYTL